MQTPPPHSLKDPGSFDHCCSHDEFVSHSTELLLFLGHSLVSPERPHGPIEQAEVKKSGFKSGFCHFTARCLSGSDLISVPQFSHMCVTRCSSFNMLWVKTESPVPPVLIPVSYLLQGPWSLLRLPSVTSGGPTSRSACLRDTIIVQSGTTDSAGAAVAPLVLSLMPWVQTPPNFRGSWPCPLGGPLLEGHQSNTTYGPVSKSFWENNPFHISHHPTEFREVSAPHNIQKEDH